MQELHHKEIFLLLNNYLQRQLFKNQYRALNHVIQKNCQDKRRKLTSGVNETRVVSATQKAEKSNSMHVLIINHRRRRRIMVN